LPDGKMEAVDRDGENEARNGRRTRTRSGLRFGYSFIHSGNSFGKFIGDSHMLLGIRLTNLWMTNRALEAPSEGHFPIPIS